MKKITILGLLVAAAIVLLPSCGGGKNATPKGIATELCNYLKKGNYTKHFDKFSEYLDDKDRGSISDAQMKELMNHMAEAMESNVKENGGFKDIEVSEEEINGDKAVVKVKYVYNNGETVNGFYDFVKRDGVWKVDSRYKI